VNRRTKIIIWVIAGIIGLCLLFCVGGYFGLQMVGKTILKSMASDNPTQVAQTAHQIIDYELPQGFTEQTSMNMLAFKMIIIGRGSYAHSKTSQVIMISEMPATGNYDEAQMRQEIQGQMQVAMARADIELTLLETKNEMIAGQDVPVYIYKGVESDGSIVKELVTGVFTGKKGKVMIFAFGPENTWDQASIDTFLASISD